MVETGTFLDLYDLFINKIVGFENTYLFFFLSFVIIAVLAAKFRFPNTITLAIFLIYSVIISVFFSSIMVVTLLIVGILFAWSISRMLSRG